MLAAFRIVGLILAVIGGSMLPSFVVSLIYDNSSVYIPFLITMLSSVAAGVFLLKIFQTLIQTLRVKDGFLVERCAGFSPLQSAQYPSLSQGASQIRSMVFESCSGFSTTGASILTDVEVLPKGILFWRSFHPLDRRHGDPGLRYCTDAFSGDQRRASGVTEAPGPIMDKTSAQMSKTAKTLYIMYLIFTVLEVILLLFGGMNFLMHLSIRSDPSEPEDFLLTTTVLPILTALISKS